MTILRSTSDAKNLTLIAEIRNEQRTNLDDKITIYIREYWYDYTPYQGHSNCNVSFHSDINQIDTTDVDHGDMLVIKEWEGSYLTLITAFLEGNFEGELLDNSFETDTFEPKYDSIEGAIIVSWNWEKYPGYARNFTGVQYGRYDKTEKDLITGNEESSFRGNMTVLLTAKEIEGLSDDDILEVVSEELRKENWKWNYFRNSPTYEKIISGLDLVITEEEDNE